MPFWAICVKRLPFTNFDADVAIVTSKYVNELINYYRFEIVSCDLHIGKFQSAICLEFEHFNLIESIGNNKMDEKNIEMIAFED